jgi:hypothetical protein
MASASDQPCELVNHYWFSFGLDDRYGDPYCDRFLYSSIALCHINGVTPPKLQAQAHRDILALAH